MAVPVRSPRMEKRKSLFGSVTARSPMTVANKNTTALAASHRLSRGCIEIFSQKGPNFEVFVKPWRGHSCLPGSRFLSTLLVGGHYTSAEMSLGAADTSVCATAEFPGEFSGA